MAGEVADFSMVAMEAQEDLVVDLAQEVPVLAVREMCLMFHPLKETMAVRVLELLTVLIAVEVAVPEEPEVGGLLG